MARRSAEGSAARRLPPEALSPADRELAEVVAEVREDEAKLVADVAKMTEAAARSREAMKRRDAERVKTLEQLADALAELETVNADIQGRMAEIAPGTAVSGEDLARKEALEARIAEIEVQLGLREEPGTSLEELKRASMKTAEKETAKRAGQKAYVGKTREALAHRRAGKTAAPLGAPEAAPESGTRRKTEGAETKEDLVPLREAYDEAARNLGKTVGLERSVMLEFWGDLQDAAKKLAEAEKKPQKDVLAKGLAAVKKDWMAAAGTAPSEMRSKARELVKNPERFFSSLAAQERADIARHEEEAKAKAKVERPTIGIVMPEGGSRPVSAPAAETMKRGFVGVETAESRQAAAEAKREAPETAPISPAVRRSEDYRTLVDQLRDITGKASKDRAGAKAELDQFVQDLKAEAKTDELGMREAAAAVLEDLSNEQAGRPGPRESRAVKAALADYDAALLAGGERITRAGTAAKERLGAIDESTGFTKEETAFFKEGESPEYGRVISLAEALPTDEKGNLDIKHARKLLAAGSELGKNIRDAIDEAHARGEVRLDAKAIEKAWDEVNERMEAVVNAGFWKRTFGLGKERRAIQALADEINAVYEKALPKHRWQTKTHTSTGKPGGPFGPEA